MPLVYMTEFVFEANPSMGRKVLISFEEGALVCISLELLP